MKPHDLVDRTREVLIAAGVRRGDRLVVAVSGGADSVALFRVLAALRDSMGFALTCVHVHHGIRPPEESDGDAAFVRALAEDLEVPFILRRVDAPAAARAHGQSLEEAARTLRRTALLEIRHSEGARFVGLGHHLDDQAETVLLRLLRGSGGLGLGGMDVTTPDGFLRPLLAERRATLRAYLRTLGQTWREDRTNGLLDAERNRVRAQILPLLEKVRPGAAARIARAAALLRDDARLLESLADRWLAVETDVNAGSWVRLPRAAWRAAPLALRRQWLRVAAHRLGLPMPSAAFTEAWSRWPEWRDARPDSPDMRLASDAWDVYVLPREHRRAGDARGAHEVDLQEVAASGVVTFASGASLSVASGKACTRKLDLVHVHVAQEDLRALRVRSLRAGDRWGGWPGRAGVPLGERLREERIPAAVRRLLYVVAEREGPRVLWVPGHVPWAGDLEGHGAATPGARSACLLWHGPTPPARDASTLSREAWQALKGLLLPD